MRNTMQYLSAVATAITVSAQPTYAETSLPLSPDLSYFVFSQDVTSFLEFVQQDTSIRIDVSPLVRGELTKAHLTGDLDQVLDKISTLLALDWYQFNGVVYISSREEAGTRVIRLGDLTPSQALGSLKESGIPLEKFPVLATGEDSALALSGPPSLLALSEAMIETIPDRQQLAAAGRSVVTRRGTSIEIVPVR